MASVVDRSNTEQNSAIEGSTKSGLNQQKSAECSQEHRNEETQESDNKSSLSKNKKRKRRRRRKGMVTILCHCGHKVKSRKSHEVISCGSMCSKKRSCGRHICGLECHPGRQHETHKNNPYSENALSGGCPDCIVMISQPCICGRNYQDIFCGKLVREEDRYDCGVVCEKTLNCGEHSCKLTCHPPPCPPCALLPSTVTHCPCGSTPLCILPPPHQLHFDRPLTCGLTCGKILHCSLPGFDHKCRSLCHGGPCPPCMECHTGGAYHMMESTPGVAVQYLKRPKAYKVRRNRRPSRRARISLCKDINQGPSDRPFVRNNSDFIEYVDEELRSFVEMVSKKSFEKVYRYKFWPMTSYWRWIVHLLAKKYGCKSRGHCTTTPPYGFVVVRTTRLKAKIPPLPYNNAQLFINEAESIFVGNRFYKIGWKTLMK